MGARLLVSEREFVCQRGDLGRRTEAAWVVARLTRCAEKWATKVQPKEGPLFAQKQSPLAPFAAPQSSRRTGQQAIRNTESFLGPPFPFGPHFGRPFWPRAAIITRPFCAAAQRGRLIKLGCPFNAPLQPSGAPLRAFRAGAHS